MSTAQRKRRGGAVHSGQAPKRNRLMVSAADTASEAEPIVAEESAGEEVVDLTCESSDAVIDLTTEESVTDEDSQVVVVDLTDSDSVAIVEDNLQPRQNLGERGQQELYIYILTSSVDDEEEPSENDGTDEVSPEQGRLENETESPGPCGTISCPICMDGYSEIVQSGRHIFSTICGHVFCCRCLSESLRNAKSCPTCRKKLSRRQYHPIYI